MIISDDEEILPTPHTKCVGVVLLQLEPMFFISGEREQL
jgi:hypothetical protein